MGDRDLERYANWHKTKHAVSQMRFRAGSSSSNESEPNADVVMAPGNDNEINDGSTTTDYEMESAASEVSSSHVSQSPPQSPPPPDSSESSDGENGEPFWDKLDNEILFFMATNLKKGKSQKDTEELFECADYIYKNGEKRLNQREYQQILDYIAQDLGHTTIHFCAACGTPVPNQNSQCHNPRCKERQKRWRRNRNRRKNTVEIFHLRTYFQKYFQYCIEALLMGHQEAHQARPDTRDDIRYSPKFKEAMESEEEFYEGKMCVQLGFNTDGFQFKGLQRGQSFPFLLPVMSLPQHLRQRMDYIPFPIIATAGKKLHTRALDLIASRLIGFLRSTQDDPIVVKSTRGDIRISVNILIAMMDFKAANEMFLMKGWQGMFGCYKCLIPGTRDGNKYCWPALSNALPRNENKGALNSVHTHAQRAIFGFKGYSRFLDIVSPTRLAPDVLHLLSEGLLNDTIFECHTSTGCLLSATARGRKILQELSDACHNSTNNRTQTLHTDDKGIVTGGEREQMFVNTYTIMALMPHTLEDIFTAPHFLYLTFLIRSIQSYVLDMDIIRMLQHVTNMYLAYHSEKFGLQYATMKLHWLEHLIQHMEEYGSPMCTTNAPHEATYHLMKMQSIPGNTRGYASSVLNRCSALLLTKREINRRATSGDPQCAAFEKLSAKKTGKKRFMAQRTRLQGIDGGFYAAKDIVPANSHLYGMVKRMLPRSTFRLFKKMGRDNYCFAGLPFVNDKQETQRTCVIIADEQTSRYYFAKVHVFAISNTGVYAIVDRYATWNPIEVLAEFMEDHPQRNTSANMKGFELLNQLAIVNQFLYEYDDEDHKRIVIPFESIIAPANTTSAQGRHFAINMASRIYHE